MAYDPDRDPTVTEPSTRSTFGNKCRTEGILSASADLNPYAKAVHVIAEGRLKVLPAQNADTKYVDIAEAPVGYTTPFVVRRIHTDTTATVIAIDD